MEVPVKVKEDKLILSQTQIYYVMHNAEMCINFKIFITFSFSYLNVAGICIQKSNRKLTARYLHQIIQFGDAYIRHQASKS